MRPVQWRNIKKQCAVSVNINTLLLPLLLNCSLAGERERGECKYQIFCWSVLLIFETAVQDIKNKQNQQKLFKERKLSGLFMFPSS